MLSDEDVYNEVVLLNVKIEKLQKKIEQIKLTEHELNQMLIQKYPDKGLKVTINANMLNSSEAHLKRLKADRRIYNKVLQTEEGLQHEVS